MGLLLCGPALLVLSLLHCALRGPMQQAWLPWNAVLQLLQRPRHLLLQVQVQVRLPSAMHHECCCRLLLRHLCWAGLEWLLLLVQADLLTHVQAGVLSRTQTQSVH